MKIIQAIRDKIAVRVIEQKKTSVTESISKIGDRGPQSYGRVVSIGEEVKNVREGDIIIFHKNAGMILVIGKTVYKLMSLGDIYGILRDRDFGNSEL